jgi:hypothetical protein
MSVRPYRPTILCAGASALLLCLTATAAAGTTHGPVISASLRAAAPSPLAPHSGHLVPGITGAAARKNDPPVSAARRFAQLNAASQEAATRKAAAGTATPAAGSATPGLTSWSGAFHGYWGAFPSQTIYGAQATESLNPGFIAPKSPGGQFVYAPTLDPSSITTIEMSTIYDSGGDYVGAWDWGAASPSFAKTATINASFLATYATKVGSQYFYSVQDVQTDAATNTWTAYLYDYETSSWDTFYTSSDTGNLGGTGGGWDMDEVYTDYDTATGEGDYCTGSYGDRFASTNLEYQLSTGSAWTPATTANSAMNLAYARGSDLGCADDNFSLTTANSAFAVANGTRGAMEITGAGSGKCVGSTGALLASGAAEELSTCQDSTAQAWAYNADGQLTVDGGKYCLNAKGNGTAAGTQINLWACATTAPSQEWTFGIHNTLIGIGSGLCLTASNAGTTNGTPLELATCTAATDQKWT